MNHDDFSKALGHLVDAYAIFGKALFDALPENLAASTRLDPVTLACVRQFGTPLVRWFGHGSALRGARVGDGTVVIDASPGQPGTLRFVPGVFAEHDRDLPDDWRSLSRDIGVVHPDRLELTA